MSKVTVNGFKGSIYKEKGSDGWTGVLDLGFKPDGSRNRPKRKGRTKVEVQGKLTQLAREIEKGIKTSREHTVIRIMTDYVDELERQGKAPGTIGQYRSQVKNHVSKIGAIKLRDLTASHVSAWLAKISETLTSEGIRKVHGLLSCAIDRAIRYELIDKNVSRVVQNIKGKGSERESKSFSPQQVQAILRTASTEIPRQRFGGYVILALTSGLRVDELNGLLWESLDLDAGTVSVVRADRYEGKTKTEESVRTLELGEIAVKALRFWREVQLLEFAVLGREVTGETPVFTRQDGAAYVPGPARIEFRRVLKAAGIENPDAWTLRETRTTFVSIMSHNGVPREQIADMCGHTVKTLERHYRKVLRPVHRQGADVINRVFNLAA